VIIVTARRLTELITYKQTCDYYPNQ